MTRESLVVAALLLTHFAGIAAAAEEPEHRSKNAQRLIATLDSLGLNNKEVRELITEVDSRVDDDYFSFAEEEVLGGHLLFRYELGSGVAAKRFELMYAPEGTPLAVTARTSGVRVDYMIKF